MQNAYNTGSNWKEIVVDLINVIVSQERCMLSHEESCDGEKRLWTQGHIIGTPKLGEDIW